mmetsp:Transcript_115193/g.332758  ORF Transcript_115193/g.332758 Transcript_115193/m.332758 type:complete len:209 (-) Transcript_115193:716-1342(-)
MVLHRLRQHHPLGRAGEHALRRGGLAPDGTDGDAHEDRQVRPLVALDEDVAPCEVDDDLGEGGSAHGLRDLEAVARACEGRPGLGGHLSLECVHLVDNRSALELAHRVLQPGGAGSLPRDAPLDDSCSRTAWSGVDMAVATAVGAVHILLLLDVGSHAHDAVRGHTGESARACVRHGVHVLRVLGFRDLRRAHHTDVLQVLRAEEGFR